MVISPLAEGPNKMLPPPMNRKQVQHEPSARKQHARAAKDEGAICTRCAHRITSGEFLRAEGCTYHKECWVCEACKSPIVGKYFKEKDASIICEPCQQARAPKCSACNRPIMGCFVTADNKSFHRECFSCQACRKQIEGEYFLTDGGSSQVAVGCAGRAGFLCAHCHEKAHPPEICGGCCRAIKGKSVTAGGKSFHPECFTCSKCKQVIAGTFVNSEDIDAKGQRLRFCSNCQPRCPICRSGLAGSRTIQVGSEKLHAACFCCSDCKVCLEGRYFEVPETNPFKAKQSKHRCAECHARALQAVEDRKAAEAVARENRKNARHAAEYKLRWRPELAPCSRRALKDLGIADAILPRSGLICVWFNEATGHVGCAPVNKGHEHAAVNLSYLACVLRVLRKHRHEPVFSLDPKDPHNLGGPNLVKRFHPEWLAGTVVGEVLFQADYALKQICFGDEGYAKLALPNTFDASATSGEERASRQWFKMKNASVSVAADGALIPNVELVVETRRLTRCSTGYTDAAYTDPKDPMVRQAAAVSQRFWEIAAQVPVAAELMALARATVLARHLLCCGCCPDDAVLERYLMPALPEGPGISEIPTLIKERRNSIISKEGRDGNLTVMSQSRSMQGGVDLTVPASKVPTKLLPMKLIDPRSRPLPLPLFLPPSAAAAAPAA